MCLEEGGRRSGADVEMNILYVNAEANVVYEQAFPHVRLQLIIIWTETEKKSPTPLQHGALQLHQGE